MQLNRFALAKTDHAYPLVYEYVDEHGVGTRTVNLGMTLRDHFAGQALTAMADTDEVSPEQIATYCYQVADAMLAEREKAR